MSSSQWASPVDERHQSNMNNSGDDSPSSSSFSRHEVDICYGGFQGPETVRASITYARDSERMYHDQQRSHHQERSHEDAYYFKNSQTGYPYNTYERQQYYYDPYFDQPVSSTQKIMSPAYSFARSDPNEHRNGGYAPNLRDDEESSRPIQPYPRPMYHQLHPPSYPRSLPRNPSFSNINHSSNSRHLHHTDTAPSPSIMVKPTRSAAAAEYQQGSAPNNGGHGYYNRPTPYPHPSSSIHHHHHQASFESEQTPQLPPRLLYNHSSQPARPRAILAAQKHILPQQQQQQALHQHPTHPQQKQGKLLPASTESLRNNKANHNTIITSNSNPQLASTQNSTSDGRRPTTTITTNNNTRIGNHTRPGMNNNTRPGPFGAGQGAPVAEDRICHNCGTKETTLWRRSILSIAPHMTKGDLVCNACGTYERLHGKARPVSLAKRSTIIRKRQRHRPGMVPTSTAPSFQHQQQQQATTVASLSSLDRINPGSNMSLSGSNECVLQATSEGSASTDHISVNAGTTTPNLPIVPPRSSPDLPLGVPLDR